MHSVTSHAGILGILNELVGAGMLLDNAVLHLYQNDITPGPLTVVADFTEATYTGYATFVLTDWGAAFIGIDGEGHVANNSHQFQPTDAVVPNTIFGYYVTKAAAPTVLIFSRRLDDPVLLNSAEDAYVCLPEYDYPG